MYCLNPTTFLPPLRAFIQNFAGIFPADVTAQVESTGDVIEDTTGVLTGAWSTIGVDAVHGSVVGGYSGASGMVVDWLTGTILDGHRVRGRSFFVPAGNSLYQDDGTILEVTRGAIAVNAADFIVATQGNFAIWHRPLTAKEAALRKRPTAPHAGGHAFVVNTSVPDLAAVLRSRRD